MNKSMKTALLAGLCTVALTSNASANYVLDGDFTSPWGGSGFVNYGVGPMGPWNVTKGNVDLIGNYWQAPVAGQGSVDLDGSTQGAISQTLGLNPGAYQLTFSFSGNPDGPPLTKLLNVSVGNVVNQLYTYTLNGNSNNSNMQYVTETLDFTTTGTTNLVFTSFDNPSDGCCYGPVVGNVAVNNLSSVPLPAGMPMFIAALLGVFGFQLSRKREQLA